MSEHDVITCIFMHTSVTSALNVQLHEELQTLYRRWQFVSCALTDQSSAELMTHWLSCRLSSVRQLSLRSFLLCQD